MTSYQIEGPWLGKLAIIPRPRGGDWLADEIRALSDGNFDVLVSLLTRDELTEFDLAAESELSRAHGLQFFEFPIPDLGIPRSAAAARELIVRLRSALEAGENIGIHCRQGIGRSGLIAAGLLVASGVDPETAFRLVSAARGLPIPETAEQERWVRDLAREFAGSLVNG